MECPLFPREGSSFSPWAPLILAAMLACAPALALADESALSQYQPGPSVPGTVTISSGKLYGQKLLQNWEAGFKKYHPEVQILYKYGKGSGEPYSILASHLSDVALMGRELSPSEALGFYRVFTKDPLVLTAATGTYNSLDKTMAMVVIVNKDNPISRLTLPQLDGIFGEQRSGGYDGQYWRPELGRGPEKNIRTWGQLGLAGQWKDRPIQTYGYDILRNAFTFYFSQKALNGGDKWNPNLKEFGFSMTEGEMKMRGASHDKGSTPLVDAVAADLYGIGYCTVRDMAPGVKALALARTDGEPYIAPSKSSVADRSYPLTRSIFWVLNRSADQPVAAPLKEYLKYVLSQQGQEDVRREGDYLPLTAEVVNNERKKLE